MAIEIKHGFVSATADSADTSQIQPSHWNAGHAITAVTKTLLGRPQATDGAVGEVTIGTGLALSDGGVLSCTIDSAAEVGLGNVDNTADADKPVSTLQAAADTAAVAAAIAASAPAAHVGAGGAAHAAATTGAAGFMTAADKVKLDGVATGATAYTPDADLVAIAALAGTSGLLRKTAADTWSLDTTTYVDLTSTQDLTNKTITSPAMEATTPTYGSDLLGGIGAFPDATGWALGSGWSITGGQAVYSSGGGTLSTTISVTSGTTYQVDWTHVSGSYNATFSIGAVSSMAAPSSGNKSVTLVAGASGSLTFAVSMSAGATIDGLTVRAVTAAGVAVVYSAKDAGGGIAVSQTITAAALANLAFGTNALNANTTGDSNLAFGLNALRSNTTGYSNLAFSPNALRYNTTGYSNLAFGTNALYTNTTGYHNLAFGLNALNANTTGYSNLAFGPSALRSNTTGYYNLAFCTGALYANTTGYYNLAFGASALYYNTTGYYNLAFCTNALYSNTTGYHNLAFGTNALRYNTTGYYNLAFGTNALNDLIPTSKQITAFADYSGTVAGTVKATSVAHGLTGTSTKQITGTVNYNGSKTITVIDADSFYFTATWVASETGWWSISTEGNNNTAVGYNTGRGIVTGSGNTILGAGVTGLAAGLTNNIILANGTGAVKAQHDGTKWTLTGDLALDKSVTAGGTTGAQTINKTVGSVNFAAAATSLVVTNSRVSTSSIVVATVAANDTTMKSVAVVAAAGSFTLYANAAASAETRVNFIVIN